MIQYNKIMFLVGLTIFVVYRNLRVKNKSENNKIKKKKVHIKLSKLMKDLKKAKDDKNYKEIERLERIWEYKSEINKGNRSRGKRKK